MHKLNSRLLIIAILIVTIASVGVGRVLAADPPPPPDPLGVVLRNSEGDTRTKKLKVAKEKDFKRGPAAELAPQTTPNLVGANSAWTTDGAGYLKTTFVKNDSIRYYGQVYNNGGGRYFYAWFYRDTPCSSEYLWQGWLYANSGTPAWYFQTSAQCPGAQTFTLWIYDQGVYTSRSQFYKVYNQSVQFGAPQSDWKKFSNCGYGSIACYKQGWYHTGIDSSGSNDILASGPGIVRFSRIGYNNNLGNTVIIEHILTNGAKIYSQYSHLKSITSIAGEGKCVNRGEKIGVKGNTPAWSVVHLHFEFKTNMTLGSTPAGYWGYTNKNPDSLGYRNPLNYVYSKYAYPCK